jgi:hypothetical protein
MDGCTDRVRYVTALEPLHALGIAVSRRGWIENAASADRRHRPQHEPIAPRGHDGRVETELRPAGTCTDDPHRYAAGAVVERQPRPVGNRIELFERDVEPVGDWEGARGDEGIAATELVPLDAGQADGDSLTCTRALDGRIVYLDAADTNAAPARFDVELVAGCERS